jgi:hypothetical protein
MIRNCVILLFLIPAFAKSDSLDLPWDAVLECVRDKDESVSSPDRYFLLRYIDGSQTVEDQTIQTMYELIPRRNDHYDRDYLMIRLEDASSGLGRIIVTKEYKSTNEKIDTDSWFNSTITTQVWWAEMLTIDRVSLKMTLRKLYMSLEWVSRALGYPGEAYHYGLSNEKHFGQKEIPEEVVKKLRPESRNWQCRGFKDDELKTAIDRLKGMIKQDAESKAEGYQI